MALPQVGTIQSSTGNKHPEDIWDGPPLEELAKGMTEAAAVPPTSENPPVSGKKVPELQVLQERIPESNRKNLRELLGGEFRGVLAWQPSAVDVRK